MPTQAETRLSRRELEKGGHGGFGHLPVVDQISDYQGL